MLFRLNLQGLLDRSALDERATLVIPTTLQEPVVDLEDYAQKMAAAYPKQRRQLATYLKLLKALKPGDQLWVKSGDTYVLGTVQEAVHVQHGVPVLGFDGKVCEPAPEVLRCFNSVPLQRVLRDDAVTATEAMLSAKVQSAALEVRPKNELAHVSHFTVARPETAVAAEAEPQFGDLIIEMHPSALYQAEKKFVRKHKKPAGLPVPQSTNVLAMQMDYFMDLQRLTMAHTLRMQEALLAQWMTWCGGTTHSCVDDEQDQD
ncbi:hypothetical protein O6R05_01700 [Peptoniphilus equinus]|uniref:Uncharacterized protein n=1 Tax=Peptoniphilus equinus TaxID=3016343 RepID=A0ABY7QVB4_9FIRM|nr:hypothetical protein [Peptoniphilus equinus]WBW50281.1 hypothetical protein O6R05_01700 [Peptoniphilus equinus]